MELGTDRTDEERLIGAFPSLLAPVVRKVGSELSLPLHRHRSSFRVTVGAETVEIPYRLYYAEPSEGPTHDSTHDEALVRACIFSRNHDGYVRQRAAQHLLAGTTEWIVPFVVQLVGEYVVEILADIWRDIGAELTDPESERTAAYQRFVRTNPDFLRLTAARVDSYWACYYRDRYPDWGKHPNRRDYPGYCLISALRSLA